MKYALILAFCLLLVTPTTADAARLFSSGCELQGDTGGDMTDLMEWDRDGDASTATQINTSIKRSGLSSCRFANTSGDGWGEALQDFGSIDVDTDLYIRFYLYIAVMPDENADIVILEQALGADDEGGLVLKTTGILEWIDDESAADGTSASPLSTGTWYRIEVNYDSASEVSVRVDGVEVINAGTHTGDGIAELVIGLCTLQGSPICVSGNATAELYFDDIAVNDTSGSAQTSWPGAGSIVHMQPDGTAGDIDQASGDCTSVDEITPDEASTIAVLDVNSDKLDCMVESPAEAGIDAHDTVTLVQVGVREGAATAASESWNMRIKSATNGTVTSGSTVAHDDTTYRTNGDVEPRNYSLTSYTDPSTGVAWTAVGTSSLDKMQIGINAVDAAPDINVSTLWALVEYVDAAAPSTLTRYALNGQALDATNNPISAATELFTAPSNSLLVVVVGSDVQTIDVQDGMSISGGGLTWTRRVGPTGYSASGYTGAHEIFTAPVTSATELQLTISHTGNCGGSCWVSAQVLAYTGYNTGSPVGATASDGLLATDGADSITLSVAPASGSQVVASRFAVPGGSTDTFATEGAGWTELYDIRTSDFGASGFGGLQTQIRGGSVSDTVSWADTNVGAVGLAFSSGVAVEIKADAGSGGAVDRMRARLQGGKIKVQGGRFKLQSN